MNRRELFLAIIGLPLVGLALAKLPPPKPQAVTIYITGVITPEVLEELMSSLEDKLTRGTVIIRGVKPPKRLSKTADILQMYRRKNRLAHATMLNLSAPS